jgi:hypothetical protein
VNQEVSMTITLELTPHVAAKLAAQAQARGISLDTYIRNLIEAQAAAVDHRGQPMRSCTFSVRIIETDLSSGTDVAWASR